MKLNQVGKWLAGWLLAAGPSAAYADPTANLNDAKRLSFQLPKPVLKSRVQKHVRTTYWPRSTLHSTATCPVSF